MSKPRTQAELVAVLDGRADDYERQADGLAKNVLLSDTLRAKAETARWAARLAASIECGKDAA